ncbi:MAG TPA: BamA/TamA family outer membrane protein [Flavisolibacter sp.]|nr:BamA/TamA family outer membrane protein [Flavisolibacter sp.]
MSAIFIQLMAKLKHLFAAFLFLTVCCVGRAQSYIIHYSTAEEDSAVLKAAGLDTKFPGRTEAAMYCMKLPELLQTKGYMTASVDSVRLDSLSAYVVLYLGQQYKWARINTLPENEALLEAVHWPPSSLSGTMDFTTLQAWEQKILDYLEETGRPFGKAWLDSISIEGNEVKATLKIKEGPPYKIDSIRVYGDAKVSNTFLQRYLELPNGSLYNKKKLQEISKKLAELVYVQEQRPSDLTLLGTGSVLNLYLKQKKSSQINALVGFQPNSDQLTGGKKLMLTVDANILLRNAFGNGETLGLVWQQLQQKSPNLNLLFERPYIFNSPFGVHFSLDMYKKDSTFLNINMRLGTTYKIEARQTATVFLEHFQTIVTNVNAAYVLQYHQLPQDADVSTVSLGAGYEFITTDYRFNPRKGNELNLTATAGTKNLKKNNDILKLQDPNNPSFKFESLYDTVKMKAYQFRVEGAEAHYLPLGGQSTVKMALNAGVYQSANYFRNELFRIGGHKLLRGFDEESQYVSQYAIGSLEYRYRIGLNSFFFLFTDGGWGKHLLENNTNHTYFGTGLGMSLETKAGIINIAWAVGKRDDTDLNLRQSKVHLGFVSYF